MAFLKNYASLINKNNKFQSLTNIIENSTEDLNNVNIEKSEHDICKLPPISEEKIQNILKKREKTIKIGEVPVLSLYPKTELCCLDLSDSKLDYNAISKLLTQVLSSNCCPLPDFNLKNTSTIPRITVVLFDNFDNHFSKTLNKRKRKNNSEAQSAKKRLKTVMKNEYNFLLKDCWEDYFENNKCSNRKKGNCPDWLQEILPQSSSLFGIQCSLVPTSLSSLFEIFGREPTSKDLRRINNNINSSETQILLINAAKKHVRASKEAKEIQIEIREKFEDKFDRRDLLLSPKELIGYGFPIVGITKPGKVFGVRNTKEKYEKVTSESPMFGIDCEMCETCAGSELTMVSMTNEKHETVYHSLVQPYNIIWNYNTRFSGITSRMLRNVKTRLKNVQEDLCQLLPSDAILVGHALHGDLRALKLAHPYVIDSSLIYCLIENQSTNSLKLLSKVLMKKAIQNSASGHDPTEDANSSLELVQYKLNNDIKFGDCRTDTENRNQKELVKENRKIKKQKDLLHEFGWTCDFNLTIFGPDFIKQEKLNIFTLEESKSEALNNFDDLNKEVIASSSIEDVFKEAAQSSSKCQIVHIKMNTSSENNAKNDLSAIDEGLSNIYASLPNYSLIVCCFRSTSEENVQFAMIDLKGQDKKKYYTEELNFF